MNSTYSTRRTFIPITKQEIDLIIEKTNDHFSKHQNHKLRDQNVIDNFIDGVIAVSILARIRQNGASGSDINRIVTSNASIDDFKKIMLFTEPKLMRLKRGKPRSPDSYFMIKNLEKEEWFGLNDDNLSKLTKVKKVLIAHNDAMGNAYYGIKE